MTSQIKELNNFLGTSYSLGAARLGRARCGTARQGSYTLIFKSKIIK
ncbi:MAG: hypothetical protein M0R17_05750 [Candidatus Omnitrophica bacterium]|jgi:hypothetical protein|nr:hypothetical protein [Candidatus Omnitrophota bacterium]